MFGDDEILNDEVDDSEDEGVIELDGEASANRDDRVPSDAAFNRRFLDNKDEDDGCDVVPW